MGRLPYFCLGMLFRFGLPLVLLLYMTALSALTIFDTPYPGSRAEIDGPLCAVPLWTEANFIVERQPEDVMLQVYRDKSVQFIPTAFFGFLLARYLIALSQATDG